MKKIRLLLTGLLSALTVSLHAQDITVAGTVTDAATGEVVAGATVLLYHRTLGRSPGNQFSRLCDTGCTRKRAGDHRHPAGDGRADPGRRDSRGLRYCQENIFSRGLGIHSEEQGHDEPSHRQCRRCPSGTGIRSADFLVYR